MAQAALAYIQSRGFHLRGLIGGLALGGCCIAALGSTPYVRLGAVAQNGAIAAAWSLLVAGILLRFWSTLYVGGRKVGGRRESVLVVDGPYSVVRNPLYLGSLLIGLSVACFLQSAFVLAAVALAAIHYVLYTIPAEEVFLRQHVGPAIFDDYAARTPRLVPDFRLYRAPAEVTLFAKALRNEARRDVRLLAAATVLTLLAAARCQVWWPAWFTLP